MTEVRFHELELFALRRCLEFAVDAAAGGVAVKGSSDLGGGRENDRELWFRIIGWCDFFEEGIGAAVEVFESAEKNVSPNHLSLRLAMLET